MPTANSVKNILASYDANAPLAEASTIPAPWYIDSRIAELEATAVFSRTWQMVGRLEQLERPGQFVTANVAGEPILVVRGNDGVLRAFTTCAATMRLRWLRSRAGRFQSCIVLIMVGIMDSMAP